MTADLDRQQRNSFEFEAGGVDDADRHLTGRQLLGEHYVPEQFSGSRMVPGRHQVLGAGRGEHRCVGEAQHQGYRPESVVAATAGDVDPAQRSYRRVDTVTDLGGLGLGERWVDVHGVVLAHDQRRGDRRPHPGAAAGQWPAPYLLDLPVDEGLVTQRRTHGVFRARDPPGSAVEDAVGIASHRGVCDSDDSRPG